MASPQPQPWRPRNFKPAKNPKNVPMGWQVGTIEGKRVAIAPPERGRKRGKVVAYNQYLNAQAVQSGFKSVAEYNKRRKVINYFRKTESKELQGKAKGVLGLGSYELRLLVTALWGPDRRNMDPGGPMAQALEAIGWRQKGATYPVGETP